MKETASPKCVEKRRRITQRILWTLFVALSVGIVLSTLRLLTGSYGSVWYDEAAAIMICLAGAFFGGAVEGYTQRVYEEEKRQPEEKTRPSREKTCIWAGNCCYVCRNYKNGV